LSNVVLETVLKECELEILELKRRCLLLLAEHTAMDSTFFRNGVFVRLKYASRLV